MVPGEPLDANGQGGQPTELAQEFVGLNEYLRAGGRHATALQRLVQLAVFAIPGCDWAGITSWPTGKGPRSLACSASVAVDVDDMQHRLHQGPCIDAATEFSVVSVPDLAEETRWPAFTAATLAGTPVRAVLSLRLADDPERVAVNTYAGQPNAFQDSLGLAALFAAHARVLLLHAERADRAANLTRALSTNRQIGMAIGILMQAYKIREDEAFDLLRESSQHLNRKLHEIAQTVTETGALPDAPPHGLRRGRMP